MHVLNLVHRFSRLCVHGSGLQDNLSPNARQASSLIGDCVANKLRSILIGQDKTLVDAAAIDKLTLQDPSWPVALTGPIGNLSRSNTPALFDSIEDYFARRLKMGRADITKVYAWRFCSVNNIHFGSGDRHHNVIEAVYPVGKPVRTTRPYFGQVEQYLEVELSVPTGEGYERQLRSYVVASVR